MAIVRPEYGPTLPELAGPHWAKLPLAVRRGLVALAVLIVLGVLVKELKSSSSPLKAEIVRGPVAFNLGHKAAITRVPNAPGELLHLESDNATSGLQSFIVKPLTLPAYSGDVSAGFLSVSTGAILQLRKDFGKTFVYRGEGRVRVNRLPGYQVEFQTRINGRLYFGKRMFLVPDEDGNPRQGVAITLLSQQSKTIPNVDSVGNNGLLKAPLRSFRFGTERPT